MLTVNMYIRYMRERERERVKLFVETEISR